MLTHEKESEAMELLDSLLGEGFDDEVNRLYGLFREAQEPNPVLAQVEEWQAAHSDGVSRFGWPWLQYQTDIMSVFDRLGLERSAHRNLIVQLSLVLAEKVEAARATAEEPQVSDEAYDYANRREHRPGASHTPCGPFFPSGKCMICGSQSPPE